MKLFVVGFALGCLTAVILDILEKKIKLKKAMKTFQEEKK